MSPWYMQLYIFHWWICIYRGILQLCRMSDDDYTDDDDVSWKVRRAASKCLVAVLDNYADMLPTLYRSACPALVGRFKEREENVKMDIFNAFIVLVHQVSAALLCIAGMACVLLGTS